MAALLALALEVGAAQGRLTPTNPLLLPLGGAPAEGTERLVPPDPLALLLTLLLEEGPQESKKAFLFLESLQISFGGNDHAWGKQCFRWRHIVVSTYLFRYALRQKHTRKIATPGTST